MTHAIDAITRLDDLGEHHDVIVVGGGQAGLAIGYYLARPKPPRPAGCGSLGQVSPSHEWTG